MELSNISRTEMEELLRRCVKVPNYDAWYEENASCIDTFRDAAILRDERALARLLHREDIKDYFLYQILEAAIRMEWPGGMQLILKAERQRDCFYLYERGNSSAALEDAIKNCSTTALRLLMRTPIFAEYYQFQECEGEISYFFWKDHRHFLDDFRALVQKKCLEGLQIYWDAATKVYARLLPTPGTAKRLIELVVESNWADGLRAICAGQDAFTFPAVMRSGHIELFNVLKEKSSNVKGWPWKRIISGSESLEKAQDLLEHGADVNSWSTMDRDETFFSSGCSCTPLHGAAGEGNLELVRLLLHHGAYVHVQTCVRPVGRDKFPYLEAGLTPLGRCFAQFDCQKKGDLMTRLEIAEELMRHGASANTLYQGCKSVFIHLIELYEEQYDFVAAHSGWKQPRQAELDKLLELMELALQQETAGKTHFDNKTFSNFYGLVRYSNRPANWVGQVSEEGFYYKWERGPHPLEVCNEYAKEVIELLLRYGFDLNTFCGEKPALFHHVANPSLAEFLVEHGANVNQVFQGRTPLLYLMSDDAEMSKWEHRKIGTFYSGDIKTVLDAYEQLVKLGADESAKDPDGVTARELYEKKKLVYQEMLQKEDACIEAERKDWERRMDPYDNTLEALLDEYGGDEDAMHSSPEYWDHLESLHGWENDDFGDDDP